MIVSPPLHHPTDIQDTLASKTRSHPRPHRHPRPAHIQDPLTSKTRSHPRPHRHPRHAHIQDPLTSKTRSHPRPARIQPRSHPMTPTSNDASSIRHTTPYCSLSHHQTAPTVNKHRVDTIHQRTKTGNIPGAGFPARFSRLVAFCARVPAQPPRARDGGRAIRARGQG